MNPNQPIQPGTTDYLRRSFHLEQQCLAMHLQTSQHIPHAGDRGETNEQHFIDFLRAYLPNRYTVDKAKVLDSTGAVSQSIDIVVFDRQYTPTLLDNQKHRYVPAEAVYAVFECKTGPIDKASLEYTGDKLASVRRLRRTSVEIHHAGGVLPAKTLFPILGGLLAARVDWADGLGTAFEANHRELTGDRAVDCGFAAGGCGFAAGGCGFAAGGCGFAAGGCGFAAGGCGFAAGGACFDTFAADGSYTFGPADNALAYFAFRLLWKLQTLATVPAVDWMAYAESLSQLGVHSDDPSE